MGVSDAPCVLAIGGLDPGGGAGILADARAVARAGAFACAAIAVLTVQSTRGLVSATPTETRALEAAIDEVLATQNVRALKIGALGSEANARAVGRLLARTKLPSVVDTVMLPTRGRARLVAERGVEVIRTKILAHATLVTANAPEAAVLGRHPVTTLAEARAAAVALAARGARAVLVKGGHLAGARAVDVLAAGGELYELGAARLRLGPTHGGGCVLASLIAGRLARVEEANTAAVVAAVRWAKRVHHRALVNAVAVGGPMRVLDFIRRHDPFDRP